MRTFEAREHLPQRGGPGLPGYTDTYRVIGRASSMEAARVFIDARLAEHPEERGHFTIATVEDDQPEGPSLLDVFREPPGAPIP
jgi:hypothetical protein